MSENINSTTPFSSGDHRWVWGPRGQAVKSYGVVGTDGEAEDKVLLCTGIGFGRLLRIGDQDVFGAEVNAASKLGEDTAQSHEILVTDSVQRQLERTTPFRFEPIDTIPPGSKAASRLLY